MKKKVILFDIDYTLFNAKLYRQKFFDALSQEIKRDKQEFDELAEKSYQESRKESVNFQPSVFLKKLSQKIDKTFNEEHFTKILKDEKILYESIYPETIKTLEKLSKDKNIEIGIFSAGRIDIQEPKITSIKKFFRQHHIHIYDAKKMTTVNDLMSHYDNDVDLYVIDDIPLVLAEVKKIRPQTTVIWIKRKKDFDPVQVANFSPDSIIENLGEVVDIVGNSN